MVAADRVALILLAAGESKRFGPDDKLDALLDDKPLRLHAGAMLADIGFAKMVAVTARPDPLLAALGYRIAINSASAAGQSRSIRIGIEAIGDVDCDAIVIALADMPRVSASHVVALLAAFKDGAIVASSDGSRAMPPALFDRAFMPQLACLSGDKGARSLLAGAILVRADPEMLADIDTPDQL